jgi:hypothetical protein
MSGYKGIPVANLAEIRHLGERLTSKKVGQAVAMQALTSA